MPRELDPNHAMVLGEDDKHYRVWHPERGEFKVAKHMLDDNGHKFLKGLPHFDDGAGPDELSEAQDQQSNTSEDVDQADSQPTRELASNDVTQPSGFAADFNASDKSAPKPFESYGSNVTHVPEDQRPATPSDIGLEADRQPAKQQGIGAPQPSKNAQPNTNPVDANNMDPFAAKVQALENIKKAGQQETTLKQNDAANTAKSLQGLLDQNALSIQQSQADMARMQKQQDQLESAMRNGNIDPNHFWSSMSTGNQIGAAISIALGGIGQGLMRSGVNPAMDVINKAIDRDMKAQELNLDKQQNLLRFNLERTKDLRQARLDTQQQLLSAAKLQLEKMSVLNGGAQAAIEQKKLEAEIQSKQADIMIEKQKFQGISGLTSSQGSSGGLPMAIATDKDLAGRVVNIGDNGNQLWHLAGSEDDAKELKSIQSSANVAKQNISEMKKIAALGNSVSPTARKRFKDLVTQTTPMLTKIAGVTRFNMDEANLHAATLGNMDSGLLTGSTLDSLNQVDSYVNRSVEAARGQRLINYTTPYVPDSAQKIGRAKK